MNKTYWIVGGLALAVGIYAKLAPPDNYPAGSPVDAVVVGQVPGPGLDISDEGLLWNCSRSNANGAGSAPCVLIKEPNRVTFSFTDSAQITFHTQNRQGQTAEVSGVQVEGSNREPAFGFCDFTNDGARCRASNGPEMVEYEAR